MSQRIPITKFLKEKYGDSAFEKTDPFHINRLLKGMICYGCKHKNPKSLKCDNNCIPWLDLMTNSCIKFEPKKSKEVKE